MANSIIVNMDKGDKIVKTAMSYMGNPLYKVIKRNGKKGLVILTKTQIEKIKSNKGTITIPQSRVQTSLGY